MDPNKIYRILVSVFGNQYTTRKKQFKINCINPRCGDTTGNLEINLDKGMFHCWRCDYSGSLRGLLHDYLGYVPKELYEDEFRAIEDFKTLQAEYQPEILKDDRFVKLPSEFCPLWSGTIVSFIGQKALHYALSRLSMDEIRTYHVGYCGLGEYRWRLIVPTFENGRVVYFIGRDFMGQPLRYKNPNKEECGVGADEVVFNLDRAKELGRAVICEGVFDAIRVGEDAVALFGSDISDEQFFKLSDIQNIYVLLDPDALSKSIKIAERFKGKERSVSLVSHLVPRGVRNPSTGKIRKDPADWPREDTRKWIESAQPFDRTIEKFLAFYELR